MLRFLVYRNKNCSAYSCKRQGRRQNFDYFTNRRLSARQKLEGGMTGVTGGAAGRWSNHDSLRCVDATTLKATSRRYVERCVLAHISVIYSHRWYFFVWNHFRRCILLCTITRTSINLFSIFTLKRKRGYGFASHACSVLVNLLWCNLGWWRNNQCHHEDKCQM